MLFADPGAGPALSSSPYLRTAPPPPWPRTRLGENHRRLRGWCQKTPATQRREKRRVLVWNRFARASSKGRATVFQTVDAGSIPAARSVTCGGSSVVESERAKLGMGVRFSSIALVVWCSRAGSLARNVVCKTAVPGSIPGRLSNSHGEGTRPRRPAGKAVGAPPLRAPLHLVRAEWCSAQAGKILCRLSKRGSALDAQRKGSRLLNGTVRVRLPPRALDRNFTLAMSPSC